VEHYVAHPGLLPPALLAQAEQPLLASVAYVDGMTDRFACAQAVALLDWSEDRLPRGQDVPAQL
jgi:dGTPase